MWLLIRSTARRPNAKKDTVIVDPTWHSGQHDANASLVATERRMIIRPRSRTREVRSGAVGPWMPEATMSFGAAMHHSANVRPAIAR
jgi:hypothetical protein